MTATIASEAAAMPLKALRVITSTSSDSAEAASLEYHVTAVNALDVPHSSWWS